MKPWIAALEKKKFQGGLYSQSYQDALIEEIFQNIGTTNSPPFCVEFGFNSLSLEHGTGANVASLVLKDSWDCLLIDGNNENKEINLHKHFIDSNNVCNLFKAYNVPKVPEYISIDLDSTDLWVFESLLEEYRAMLFSVEYNANYPLDAAITFPNDPNQFWEKDRGYGASLKALTSAAKQHGYSLLWVVPHLDAFFIRNDLIDDGSNELVFPYQKWQPWTNFPAHAPLKNAERLSLFLDYDEFVRTGGDATASAKRAYPITKAFLTDSMDPRSVYLRGLRRFVQDTLRFGRGLKAAFSRRMPSN